MARKRAQALSPDKGINLTVWTKSTETILPGDGLVLDTTDTKGYGVKKATNGQAPLLVALVANHEGRGENQTFRQEISAKAVGKYNTILALPSDDTANLGETVVQGTGGKYTKETVLGDAEAKGFLVMRKEDGLVEVLF